MVDKDPAAAIVRAAEQEGSDVLVVGNVGMSGRKEFLLRNVPNRVSHRARCTVIIVNSALRHKGAADAAPGGAAAQSPGTAEPHLATRGLQIASVMARHGLKAFFDGSEESSADERRRRAKHFREALEELGPTFSKLGQVLSTRPDLLPAEYIEELMRRMLAYVCANVSWLHPPCFLIQRACDRPQQVVHGKGRAPLLVCDRLLSK